MLAPDVMCDTSVKRTNQALLLFDARRNLSAISPAATRLLNLSADHVKGQPVDRLININGALSAIALRSGSIRTSTMFELTNGHVVFANTRTLVGHNHRVYGWLVALYSDVISALVGFPIEQHTSLPSNPVLQQQIQNMRELIAMLPRFSQHRYWQSLLMEHMERLIEEMDMQCHKE